ncbi:MAG: TetR/AcrR family transcriptional regulator [Bacteroidetes bacterium]|nr:TetR/AcrR family transcriptional regulator [Bacteroidota bacterium]
MAKDTKDRLMQSALELFSSQWYETASIADICRQAGLSNGVFYRYFRNKEMIFSELIDRFLERFSVEMGGIQGNTLEKRLECFIKVLISVGTRYRQWVTLFREGQYRFPEYEKQLRELYLRSLKLVFCRDVSESEYLFIVSGLRFISTRSLYENQEFSYEIIKKIVLEGVFPETLREGLFNPVPAIDFSIEEAPESRRRLLMTGISLFGSKGFHKVGIYEIVHTAGYAVGTFYTHFTSKKLFLEEIIILIGKTVRHFITKHLSPGLNSLEREIQGYWLFVQLFIRHPEFYQIVREAEFVVKKSVSDYYNKFQKGYVRNFQDIPFVNSGEKGLLTVSNYLIGIAHYLGIEILFSKNVVQIEDLLKEVAGYLAHGISQGTDPSVTN